ncbi:MAG: hypothetical protein GX410_10575 [Elusimicrobia bacterium]|nr:hypothetical protein [Elusimicrobiota bacterium]
MIKAMTKFFFCVKLRFLPVAALLAFFCAGQAFADYVPTDKEEVDEVTCASKKMQIFFYYLASNRSQTGDEHEIECKGRKEKVKSPLWINEELPRMLGTKAWRDPVEGEITEAQLWQTPISLVYAYMEIAKKTFMPADGGSGVPPSMLTREFADAKVRYQLSLDRVYRARLFDSMGGRGRTMLSLMSLIDKEMDAVGDALAANNQDQFISAITATAVLSQDMFQQAFSTPRGQFNDKSGGGGLMPLLLTGIGLIICFFGTYKLLTRKETTKLIEEYTVKSEQWTSAFNRQFLKVKVQYLVGAPIGVFALAGMMTGNFILFLLFTGAGVVVGLKAPMIILDILKERRGKNIDAQLIDALILLSNSLKSGMDIVQGFEMVGQDLQPPISEEFLLVIKNYQLGTSFEHALEGMEERVSSRLLSYMIKAIVIQRQVGGNLTKIFERIVDNIREESKLEEKTKALTAQQRIQSMVVGIMPWILVGMMFMFQPDTMTKFYTSVVGIIVLIFCIFWIAIGMKLVAAMGKIKV